jgi:hypothetical protein
MNERIKELMAGAVTFYLDPDSKQYEAQVCPEDLELFAELIVRECAEVGLDSVEDGDDLDAIMKRVHNNILKHFGVEE